MSISYFGSFREFCSHTNINTIEAGLIEGDDWHYVSLQAPYNRLYIVLEGEGIIRSGPNFHHLKAGKAYLIPAGYDFDCDSPVYLSKLFFHFIAARDYEQDVFHQQKEVMALPIDIHDYLWLKDVLMHQVLDDYYKAKYACNGLIYAFIDQVIKDHPLDANQVAHPLFKNINALITNHLSAQLQVSWLAHQLGLNRIALSKYYKSITGTTLKEALLDKLIHGAQIKLLTEDKQISEIARDLGYQDRLYFTKVFTKRVGMSPKMYRQKNGYGHWNPSVTRLAEDLVKDKNNEPI